MAEVRQCSVKVKRDGGRKRTRCMNPVRMFVQGKWLCAFHLNKEERAPTYVCGRCNKRVKRVRRPLDPCFLEPQFWPPSVCPCCGLKCCDKCQTGGRGTVCDTCEI